MLHLPRVAAGVEAGGLRVLARSLRRAGVAVMAGRGRDPELLASTSTPRRATCEHRDHRLLWGWWRRQDDDGRRARAGRPRRVAAWSSSHRPGRAAQSLGLTEPDNTPDLSGVDESTGGSLDAMMLDMKRTFDDVVSKPTQRLRTRRLRSWPTPSTRRCRVPSAGTQEYMAMEKPSASCGPRPIAPASGTSSWWTPPSRSALDSLDAPKRLGSFLDGRFIRLLSAPRSRRPRLPRLHGRGVAGRDQHDRQDPGG